VGLQKFAVFEAARSQSYAKLFCKKLVDRHFCFSERDEINRKVGAATMPDFFSVADQSLVESTRHACIALQLYGSLAPSR
jgi:hypothetical protein